MIKRLIMGLFAGLLVTTNAFTMENGFYYGIQLGSSNTNNLSSTIPSSSPPVTTSIKPSNTGMGGRLFMGGLFNRYAGVEMGLTYFAPSTYQLPDNVVSGNPQVKEVSIDVLGRLIYPIAYGFGVYAKGGFAVLMRSASGSLHNPTNNKDVNNKTTSFFRPAWAVGISYDITQRWQAELSFQRIQHGGGGLQNADLVALGVSYHVTDVYCGQFLC